MALAILGVILASSANATANVDTSRVAGTNRYGTACAAAQAAFPGGTSTAIIATGENFPDALAAAALAGDLQAPVLLVQRDSVPSETANCLQALGVTKVVIVGGTGAISSAVEQELAQSYAVSRVSGGDRYATAAAVADALTGECSLAGGKTAIIATGENYPDALAAGPLAYVGDGGNACPILLVQRDGIPQATRDALTALGINNIIVMGGTGAVSASTMAQLAALTGDASPTRIAGINREGTAADAGDALRDIFGCPIDTVLIAGGRPLPGQTFTPDPLSASALGGELCAPVLLIPSANDLGDDAASFIGANKATISDVIGVGGTAVVGSSALSDAENAGETGTTTTSSSSSTSSTSSTTSTTAPGGVAVTKRPELKSASFTTNTVAKAPSGSSPGRDVGVYATYTFDEAVLNTDAALLENNFFLYENDNTRHIGQHDSYTTRPRVLSGGAAVEVFYPDITTTDASARLTIAAAMVGAVKDSDGLPNPEGGVPIGSSASSSITAGKSDGPDLTSIGSFADDPASTGTLVRFTFDQKAWATGGGDFQLVLSNSDVITCNNSGTGNGTTALTVSCPADPSLPYTPAGATKYATTQVIRGAVLEGTVNSTAALTGTDNPLETTTGSTGSNSPDLASVAGTKGGSGANDTVVFTFDEGLTGTPDWTMFHVYKADGSTTDGINAVWGNALPKQVAIEFPNGTLDTSVGASLDTGAGDGVGGNPTKVAELPLSGAGGTIRTPGFTSGPQLTGVTVQGVPPLGLTWVAVFTFDEKVTVIDGTAFSLYESDGALHTSTACTVNAAPDDSKVTCSFGAATAAEIHRSVVGTVAFDAVEDVGNLPNTEGARPAAGTNGTAQS